MTIDRAHHPPLRLQARPGQAIILRRQTSTWICNLHRKNLASGHNQSALKLVGKRIKPVESSTHQVMVVPGPGWAFPSSPTFSVVRWRAFTHTNSSSNQHQCSGGWGSESETVTGTSKKEAKKNEKRTTPPPSSESREIRLRLTVTRSLARPLRFELANRTSALFTMCGCEAGEDKLAGILGRAGMGCGYGTRLRILSV